MYNIIRIAAGGWLLFLAANFNRLKPGANGKMVNQVSNDLIPHASAIVSMIEQARQNALKSVNTELIQLYWNVGEYLSKESVKTSWGEAFIDGTANYIKENCPEIKGFTRRGLYRMRQFYETYNGNEFVSPLVTQISWTNHLLILSGTKTIEEKT